MAKITRRTALASVLALMPIAARAEDSWAPVADILKRIQPPVFPDRDFHLGDYAGVNAAIDACAAVGGGRVVVPAGNVSTGPIVLKSKVNLYLAKGATLKFSQDPADYPLVLTRFEGVECMNYSPFVYAYGQSDIAITGEGTLDGQADEAHWWDWTKQARDPAYGNAVKLIGDMADQNVPVAERIVGAKGRLRPNFIQPYACQNILIEGITIVRSPMWEIHPVLSRNITVRGVKIDSTGPNNDGCDPECCADVLIEDVTFNTGDDCIAIKSGRNADGRRINKPSENIVVRNCRMVGGHGGVSLGSEASGGIRNIYVRDCHMGSPNLNRALRLKSNSYRGGYIENVVFRDVTVDQVADDIFQVDLTYGEGAGGAFNPRVGHVLFENVTCGKARRAFDINGYADDIITAIAVRNCTFDNAAEPPSVHNAEVTTVNVRINGAPFTA